MESYPISSHHVQSHPIHRRPQSNARQCFSARIRDHPFPHDNIEHTHTRTHTCMHVNKLSRSDMIKSEQCVFVMRAFPSCTHLRTDVLCKVFGRFHSNMFSSQFFDCWRFLPPLSPKPSLSSSSSSSSRVLSCAQCPAHKSQC